MWWACNQQLSHSATCRRMGAQTKESSHITQGFVFHTLHKCRRGTWRTRVLATKLSHSLRQFPSWSAHPIAHSLRPVQGMLWTLHAVAPNCRDSAHYSMYTYSRPKTPTISNDNAACTSNLFKPQGPAPYRYCQDQPIPLKVALQSCRDKESWKTSVRLHLGIVSSSFIIQLT